MSEGKDKNNPEDFDNIREEIDSNRIEKIKNFEVNINSKHDKYSENTISYERLDMGNNNFNYKSENKNKLFFRVFWLIITILISAVFARYILLGINDMLAINRKDSSSVSINIPRGANVREVARILNDAGVINNPGFFKLYVRFTGAYKEISNGLFDIRKNMDYEAIINYLKSLSNRLDVLEITFQEGLNVTQYARLLEQNGVCGYEEFLNACNSDVFDAKYDFISDIDNANERYYKLEGYLFPDTYQFYKGESPENAIRRFIANFNKKIYSKQVFNGYDEKISIVEIASSKGMSVSELINIASIIQAESANVEDMYKVSSVLRNRLSTLSSGVSKYGEAGLGLLGMDSTVWYPYRSSKEVPDKIKETFSSRYNTYNIQGLPPGPINNPGLDSIMATLNPSSTDYYYFCHNVSTKEAYYAKTLAEHQSNLVKAGLK